MKLYTDNELTAEVGARRGAPVKWVEEAAELRANPGIWGEIEGPKSVSTFALNVKRGLLKSFQPRGEWEAKAQNGRVFVRYVGGAQ